MFELLHQDPSSSARRGRLTTAHGAVETPVFMPVGTRGSVKTVSPQELRDLGSEIILGNTYHLSVRPGTQIIDHFGGLHAFMNWDRAILTDSGGFQVWSLAKLREISEEGVHFQNHIDGTPTFISPEISMQIQASLGSDIAMLFDECPPYPCEHDYAKKSGELTLRWAERCKEWITDNQPCAGGHDSRQLHFGIVQGSTYPELREHSARELVKLDFDGYAVGGVSVGEPEKEMLAAIENSLPYLPESKPRYAMGLGTPPQLIEMIARGVDMFDCVLPTRVARTATAYTASGTINLKNRKFAQDKSPIEEGCHCHACREGFSRGYIRHLVKSDEILGIRLTTLHNLHFYLNLLSRARASITNGTFDQLRREMHEQYPSKSGNNETP
ncbi:MAG: tRNA guanosine(34) transglycosylase Tgt [Verrucomicrobiota bacterium]|nr:tRNA guanosine(34) transglycosylase Tgt [Verrucomicrobiota bacterium]